MLTMAPTTRCARIATDSFHIMRCSQLIVLILTFGNFSATQATRRSLSNIFNRTGDVATATGTSSSVTSKKATSTSIFNQRVGLYDDTSNSKYAADEMILPERRRRLGVGSINNRPNDDFIEGVENMHRFFDKMTMSMATEVSLLDKAI